VLTVEHVVRPSPDVIHTTLYTRETVLLHVPTTTYYSLNQTGARIWRLMGDGLTLGEIAKKMVKEYDVAPAAAQSSVFRLAEVLIQAKLSSIATG
jgi:hypothetical protein